METRVKMKMRTAMAAMEMSTNIAIAAENRESCHIRLIIRPRALRHARTNIFFLLYALVALLLFLVEFSFLVFSFSFLWIAFN
jgi:hypothetical protein